MLQEFFYQPGSLIDQPGIELDQRRAQVEAPPGILGIHDAAYADDRNFSIDVFCNLTQHRFAPRPKGASTQAARFNLVL